MLLADSKRSIGVSEYLALKLFYSTDFLPNVYVNLSTKHEDDAAIV
jgi:hypothetical protein